MFSAMVYPLRASYKRQRGGLFLSMAGAALLLMAGPLAAEDWPQFRGPNCGGVSTSNKPLPVNFSKSSNMRWMTELGDDVSSPWPGASNEDGWFGARALSLDGLAVARPRSAFAVGLTRLYELVVDKDQLVLREWHLFKSEE